MGWYLLKSVHQLVHSKSELIGKENTLFPETSDLTLKCFYTLKCV
jgi:hypothetical protein